MDRYTGRDSGLILSTLTSGDCAAAAARAAAAFLLLKIDYEYVTVKHGNGNSRTISVYRKEDACDSNSASFYAVMEGGTAPDIRERAEIYATVSRITDFKLINENAHIDVRYGNLFLAGGEGIGTAASDAPGLRKGDPLIERDARALIFDAVAGACEATDGAQLLLITVSCPEGMMIAARQTTGQTVFQGGIAIMGEKGTFPHIHQREITESTTHQLVKQVRLGVKSVLVSPGNYCADKIYESIHVSLKTAINCYNYPGHAIDTAVEHGVENLLLVGNVGKLVKLAAGIMNTNSIASDGRKEIFAAHTAMVGGTSSQTRLVMSCVTCDEILAMLDGWGIREKVMASIMDAIEESVNKRCYGKLNFGVALFSETFGLLGQTKGTRNVLVKVSQEQYALSLKLK